MARFTLTGQTLGKYQILEPLGKGGMSQVYRAYHPQLDRYVALKVIRGDLVDEEGFLDRFQREARVVAGLRHPNIVQVHDFDSEDDLSYMVMELLEGDTLKSRLTNYHLRGERMPLGDVIRVMLDVLDGLAFAHDNGMIHRDIKPANILLTNDGQAVLADFGIAQIVGATRQTASGALMGTLRYMAPEQGLEGAYDARTDIYALGIVFYEMLFQNPPFDADTPLAVLMKHLNDPLPIPEDHGLPADIETILLRSLAKDPADRYQSAGKMAKAMYQAAQSLGLELPEQISAPLTFKTVESSGEGVAVLSGKSRDALKMAQFADDETAMTNLEAFVYEDNLPVTTDTNSDLRTASKVLNSIGVTVGFTVFAVFIAGLIGQGNFWENSWPIIIFMVGAFLFSITRITQQVWTLLPSGILFLQALLFSYFSLTNRWSDYSFLWIVQVAIVIFPIIFTINVAASNLDDETVARRLGALGVVASYGMALLVVLIGALVG